MKILSYTINHKVGYIILETTNGFFRISKSGKVERRSDRKVRPMEPTTKADGYYESPCNRGKYGISAEIIGKCYRILGV